MGCKGGGRVRDHFLYVLIFLFIGIIPILKAEAQTPGFSQVIYSIQQQSGGTNLLTYSPDPNPEIRDSMVFVNGLNTSKNPNPLGTVLRKNPEDGFFSETLLGFFDEVNNTLLPVLPAWGDEHFIGLVMLAENGAVFFARELSLLDFPFGENFHTPTLRLEDPMLDFQGDTTLENSGPNIGRLFFNHIGHSAPFPRVDDPPGLIITGSAIVGTQRAVAMFGAIVHRENGQMQLGAIPPQLFPEFGTIDAGPEDSQGKGPEPKTLIFSRPLLADFNGDGCTDLALLVDFGNLFENGGSSEVPDTLALFAGDCQGGFSAPQQHPLGFNGYITDLAAGDFDQDGSLELAVVYFMPGIPSKDPKEGGMAPGRIDLISDPLGAFQIRTGPTLPGEARPVHAHVSDCDFDGALDDLVLTGLILNFGQGEGPPEFNASDVLCYIEGGSQSVVLFEASHLNSKVPGVSTIITNSLVAPFSCGMGFVGLVSHLLLDDRRDDGGGNNPGPAPKRESVLPGATCGDNFFDEPNEVCDYVNGEGFGCLEGSQCNPQTCDCESGESGDHGGPKQMLQVIYSIPVDCQAQTIPPTPANPMLRGGACSSQPNATPPGSLLSWIVWLSITGAALVRGRKKWKKLFLGVVLVSTSLGTAMQAQAQPAFSHETYSIETIFPGFPGLFIGVLPDPNPEIVDSMLSIQPVFLGNMNPGPVLGTIFRKNPELSSYSTSLFGYLNQSGEDLSGFIPVWGTRDFIGSILPGPTGSTFQLTQPSDLDIPLGTSLWTPTAQVMSQVSFAGDPGLVGFIAGLNNHFPNKVADTAPFPGVEDAPGVIIAGTAEVQGGRALTIFGVAVEFLNGQWSLKKIPVQSYPELGLLPSGPNNGGNGPGQGQFDPSVTQPRPLLADFDADGCVDLALLVDFGFIAGPPNPGNTLEDYVAMFRGNCSGGFAPPIQHMLGKNFRVSDLAAGDLNGDGRLELVIVYPGWKLFENSPPGKPTLTSVIEVVTDPLGTFQQNPGPPPAENQLAQFAHVVDCEGEGILNDLLVVHFALENVENPNGPFPKGGDVLCFLNGATPPITVFPGDFINHEDPKVGTFMVGSAIANINCGMGWVGLALHGLEPAPGPGPNPSPGFGNSPGYVQVLMAHNGHCTSNDPPGDSQGQSSTSGCTLSGAWGPPSWGAKIFILLFLFGLHLLIRRHRERFVLDPLHHDD